MLRFLPLFLLVTATTAVAAQNHTVPLGNWDVTVTTTCTRLFCELRLLHWKGWDLETTRTLYGQGIFALGNIEVQDPHYFFRMQGGEYEVTYTPIHQSFAVTGVHYLIFCMVVGFAFFVGCQNNGQVTKVAQPDTSKVQVPQVDDVRLIANDDAPPVTDDGSVTGY